MNDRVELMKRLAADEELTVEELAEVQDYIAGISNKLQLDPEAIYKHMWRGVPKADRLPAQPVRSTPKINRNEPCPCGSGKKYKQCCING